MTALGVSAVQPAPTRSAASTLQQLLAFRLGDEYFAVEILRVLEIRELTPITPIPNAPAYVKGVMNLRGTIVPVVDLRMRFGVGEPTYHDFTVIIVVSYGTRYIGLVVDAMSNVLEVAADQITSPSELSLPVDAANIAGIIRHGDDIVLLLNLDRLLAFDLATDA